MTTFLTFGVYALKLNNEMPIQSEYFPLASVYFIVALVYTLISMAWFVMANHFVITKRIPSCFLRVAELLRKWFSMPAFKSKNTQETAANSDIEYIDKINLNLNRRTSFGDIEDIDRINLNLNRRTSIVDLMAYKHIFCKCNECEKKEIDLKNSKEIFNKNLRALNYLALFFVFLIMLVSNIYIWIAVSLG